MGRNGVKRTIELELDDATKRALSKGFLLNSIYDIRDTFNIEVWLGFLMGNDKLHIAMMHLEF